MCSFTFAVLRAASGCSVADKFIFLVVMSGLRKAKKYDWKDSNLALFGSDVEKNVRAG